jgi:indolepyruvate ferredoxin oxidoreductase beta subunit
MTFDIVLAGVGGQGVLSLAALVAAAALDDGLYVKQSEVHGMSQRGGAVTSHLRLANHPIESELIPLGSASMILSLEPLESLRYLPYLAPNGWIVSATDPVKNLSTYPPLQDLLGSLRARPSVILVDAGVLARQAGLPRATNMVIAGAASSLLPVRAHTIERCVRTRFERMGATVVEQNLSAFHAGQRATWITTP